MGPGNMANVAFSRPGGERCADARTRPIDLVHLARQTLGDRALEQEVLSLFSQQLAAARDRMPKAVAAERTGLAHTLKGAANGVGAFPIASCAADIETAPADDRQIARLTALIDEARDFIATISR